VAPDNRAPTLQRACEKLNRQGGRLLHPSGARYRDSTAQFEGRRHVTPGILVVIVEEAHDIRSVREDDGIRFFGRLEAQQEVCGDRCLPPS
jgi:hypothetical protein